MDSMKLKNDDDQPFVYPWMGILANIPQQHDGTRFVGESGSKLRDMLTAEGFSPQRVITMWDGRSGFSGFAVVEFKRDWMGFSNAVNFDKWFEGKQHGKKDYFTSRARFVGDELYGWIAQADDFRSSETFGPYLRKKADLKTVLGVEEDEKKKLSSLVSNLTQEIDVKAQTIKHFERKNTETSEIINKIEGQKEDLQYRFDETCAELKRMQELDSSQLKDIFAAHKEAMSSLEVEKRKLLDKEEELRKKQVVNNQEREKLAQQRERERLAWKQMMNKKATEEQKGFDEHMLMLAAKHKRAKEKLHARIIEIQKKLDAKSMLVLEIETLKGAIQVKKHLGDEGDEAGKKLVQIQNELKEKEEELESMTELNQALIIKERNTNDELQDARKELIKHLNDSANKVIGVKRVGDVHIEPFRAAIKDKMSTKKKVELTATELCAQWSEELRNPHWHPYKMVPIAGTDNFMEIVDPDDEKLSKLRRELGEGAYEAVARALRELNEYNRSGRYPVLELWNFKDDKRALLKEGCAYAVEQLKRFKRRK